MKDTDTDVSDVTYVHAHGKLPTLSSEALCSSLLRAELFQGMMAAFLIKANYQTGLFQRDLLSIV